MSEKKGAKKAFFEISKPSDCIIGSKKTNSVNNTTKLVMCNGINSVIHKKAVNIKMNNANLLALFQLSSNTFSQSKKYNRASDNPNKPHKYVFFFILSTYKIVHLITTTGIKYLSFNRQRIDPVKKMVSV